MTGKSSVRAGAQSRGRAVQGSSGVLEIVAVVVTVGELNEVEAFCQQLFMPLPALKLISVDFPRMIIIETSFEKEHLPVIIGRPIITHYSESLILLGLVKGVYSFAN